MAYRYVTKKLIYTILEDACKRLDVEVPPVKFIRRKLFTDMIKQSEINKYLIEIGAYVDFENEVPTYAACMKWSQFSESGKDEIFFCLPIADTKLKKFRKDEIYENILGVLAHEIGHIKELNADLIENESVANSYIRKIVDYEKYNSVVERLYAKILERGWQKLKEQGIERPVE